MVLPFFNIRRTELFGESVDVREAERKMSDRVASALSIDCVCSPFDNSKGNIKLILPSSSAFPNDWRNSPTI